MKLAGLVLVLTTSAGANAEIVDLKWTSGTFTHKSSVAPRKILEVCGKLKSGQTVAWQFTGSAPADFNIHYHIANAVTYPVKRAVLRPMRAS